MSSATNNNININNHNSNIVNTPLKNDIKSGAGVHSHPGNKFYLQLIKEKKKPFVLALKDTKKKDAIVRQVYDTISKLKPPGRFLQKNRDGTFTIRSKQYALAKIKKALGENSAQIESFFRTRGLLPEPATSLPNPKRPASIPNHKRPAHIPKPPRQTITPYEASKKQPSVGTRRKRPEIPTVSPEPMPIANVKPNGITSADWRKFATTVGNINDNDIKQIKRPRFRDVVIASLQQEKDKPRREKPTMEKTKSQRKVDMLIVALANMTPFKGNKKR